MELNKQSIKVLSATRLDISEGAIKAPNHGLEKPAEANQIEGLKSRDQLTGAWIVRSVYRHVSFNMWI